jgi:hypothetical protein
MSQVSTKKMATAVMKQFANAVRDFGADFSLSVSQSECLTIYPEVTARNDHAFIRMTWSPQDGCEYYIGPLVNNSVPDYTLAPNLAAPLLEYELEWFSKIRTNGVLPMVRGKSGPTDQAVVNAFGYITRYLGDCLCGDWSIRESLELAIRKEIASQGL